MRDRGAFPLPSSLSEAFDQLRKAGGRPLLVGGCVRDFLLGNSPTDYDVEVFGLPLEAIAEALRPLGRSNLVGKSFCVVKLWMRGEDFDFSVPRRETKQGQGHRGFEVAADPFLSEGEALARRDFTINAMMYDPIKEQLIDPHGGRMDLEKRCLRRVSDAFSEDPLRVLRAMQFTGRFDLTLESETADACRSIRREVNTLPVERVWHEWRKWAVLSKNHSAGLRALKAGGWLVHFTELNALVGMPQDPEWHPEGDVWNHTLHCLDALRGLPRWEERDEAGRCTLALAVLCHDLGKAIHTRFAEKKGKLRWISPGHDAASGPLSRKLLARIGAPFAVIDRVDALVTNHHFLNSIPGNVPSPSSLRRLALRLHPATATELELVMRADHLGRPPFISEEQSERLDQFARGIAELEVAEEKPKPLLMGRHLVARNWAPGPNFKQVLDKAFALQLDGEIKSLKEAELWLEANYPR